MMVRAAGEKQTEDDDERAHRDSSMTVAGQGGRGAGGLWPGPSQPLVLRDIENVHFVKLV